MTHDRLHLLRARLQAIGVAIRSTSGQPEAQAVLIAHSAELRAELVKLTKRERARQRRAERQAAGWAQGCSA